MIGAALGPYRIASELGSGGMGTVYAATVEGRGGALEVGKRVAIKVVHPHLLERPGFFKRFLREAQIGRAVAHRNVIRTFDCDSLTVDGARHDFLVMEYVEGQTLRALLEELVRVPEELCRHVGREVADGLAAIHAAGVIHRDLKPENVLITDEHVVKVMDLGVARLQDEALRLSQTGVFVGSLHYAAPEQFGGDEVQDQRVDLHALGLLLYELSSGRHPYFDEDFRVALQRLLHEEPRRVAELNPQLSPFFEELTHTLLAKKRDSRFASAAEVAEILRTGEKSKWWQDRARVLRSETSRPLRRIRVPREAPVVGRDDELAALRARFEEARAGRGRVVLIEGEAGIGKTRLVDAFIEQLRSSGEDVNFLFGSYPPGGAATGTGAFSTAYREHFGEEGLEQSVAAYLPAASLLVPPFAALLRGEPPPTGEHSLTADSLQTVFVRATQALAAERPTIVLIDDLHFAPEEGRALFAALAMAVPGHRVLLLGTTRPGIPERWVAEIARLDHATQIEMGRLATSDLTLLVCDVLGSGAIAGASEEHIARSADGNPFFLFEILGSLRDGGHLRLAESGGWMLTAAFEQIAIAVSVRELVEARLADLDESERDLLDLAACYGYTFDPLVVGAALGVAPISVLKALARVETRHRLVRSAGDSFVFDHHQIHEVLRRALPPPLAREYHGAIASALEARHCTGDRDLQELSGGALVSLSEHLLAAGRGEDARRYLRPALGYLTASYLLAAAEDLARRALEVPALLAGAERMEILFLRSDALSGRGPPEVMSAVLDEAREIAEELGDALSRARAGVALGLHLGNLSRSDEAVAQLESAAELARSVSSTFHETRANSGLATVACSLGEYARAQRLLERCIALAETSGDTARRSQFAGNLAVVHMFAGDRGTAKQLFEESLEGARAVGDRQTEANALGNYASLLYTTGHFEEARSLLLRHLELAHEIGDRRGEALFVGNLGNVERCLGRYADAMQQWAHSARVAHEIGAPEAVLTSALNQGDVSALLGRLDAAEAHLDEALALARRDHVRELEGETLRCRAALRCQQGRHDEAERLFRRVVRMLRTTSARPVLAGAIVSLGSFLRTHGDPAEARGLLEEGLALSRDVDGPDGVICAAAHLAAISAEHAASVAATLAAYEHRASDEARREAHFVLWELTGDEAHLREGKRLLDHAVEHSPLEHRTTMIENVPLHRAIETAWREYGQS